VKLTEVSRLAWYLAALDRGWEPDLCAALAAAVHPLDTPAQGGRRFINAVLKEQRQFGRATRGLLEENQRFGCAARGFDEYDFAVAGYTALLSYVALSQHFGGVPAYERGWRAAAHAIRQYLDAKNEETPELRQQWSVRHPSA